MRPDTCFVVPRPGTYARCRVGCAVGGSPGFAPALGTRPNLHFRRFRVMKDVIGLRPIYHWSERRVRGHIALCVLAATVEAVMAKDLAAAGVMDPDLPGQVLSPRRANAELQRVRRVTLDAGDQRVRVVTSEVPSRSTSCTRWASTRRAGIEPKSLPTST